MIKKIIFTSAVLMLLITVNSSAQIAGHCGTINQEWRDNITNRLLENKRLIKDGLVQQRNAITYIPVTFHLVGDNDGDGRILETNVLNMLCRMNDDYFDQEIQFFIHDGFNYVNSTAAFTGPGSFAGGLKMRSEKVDGTVNIYICQNANTSGGIGTTLGYYDPSEDWLVLRKQEVTYGSATIGHELGHFFSLLHTFNGWDSVNYDQNTHGNPVQGISPGGVVNEREARSGSCKNCDNAGDFICDTPPDYNFGFGWNTCNFTSQIMDPCGDVVDPEEVNFMGYFLQCSDYIFSDGQKDLVAADIQQRYQFNLLNDDFQPSTTEVLSGGTTLEIPENGETLAFKNVFFDWEAVEGADAYILEIDQFNSFNVFYEKYFITDGTSRFELDLDANKTYFWRVTPYNEYSSCAGTTPTNSFTTGSSVSTTEIASVSTWSVSPNPVSSGSTATLMLDTQEMFNGNIRIHNLAGQLVSEIRNQTFNIGNNNVALNIGDLTNGTYLVSVQSENGIINNKIVVAR